MATEEEKNLEEELDLELAGEADDETEGFTWDQFRVLFIELGLYKSGAQKNEAGKHLIVQV